MGVLAILCGEGDQKVIWDPTNSDETLAAKQMFESLSNKKFLAYKVNRTGGKGALIKKFDPKAGKIIMSPPIVGG